MLKIPVDAEFRSHVLDQLSGMGEFETKNIFVGTTILRNSVAFAKVKHGSLWLKVDNGNIAEFVERGMTQYTYGKDDGRKLNFFETPLEVLVETDSINRMGPQSLRSG